MSTHYAHDLVGNFCLSFEHRTGVIYVSKIDWDSDWKRWIAYGFHIDEHPHGYPPGYPACYLADDLHLTEGQSQYYLEKEIGECLRAGYTRQDCEQLLRVAEKHSVSFHTLFDSLWRFNMRTKPLLDFDEAEE